MANGDLNSILGDANAARSLGDISRTLSGLTGEAQKLQQQLKEVGNVAQESMSKFSSAASSATNDVKKMGDTVRESFVDNIVKGVDKAKNALNAMEGAMVKHRRAIVDTTTAMGAYGRSTSDIIQGNAKLTASFTEVTDSMTKMAASGRITFDQARESFRALSKEGLAAAETMRLFADPATGALGLVNSGMLELSDVTKLASTAIVQLGSSMQSTERMLLRIADSVGKVNRQFGGSVLSTHMLQREVYGLMQSFRFLGTDVEGLPGYLSAFAGAAERFRGTTGGRGITGAAALEVGRQYAQTTAGFGLENRAFFGQMGGMAPGALAAGEQFRMMLQRPGGAGRAVGNVVETLQQLSGGRLLSSADFERASIRGAGAAESVAQRRALQAQLIQQFLGGNEQQAYSFLDLSGDREGQAEFLRNMKENTKDPLIEIKSFLEKSQTANQHALQTSQELLSDIKSGLLRFSGNFSVLWGTHVVALVANAAAQLLQLRFLTRMLATGQYSGGPGGGGFFGGGGGGGGGAGGGATGRLTRAARQARGAARAQQAAQAVTQATGGGRRGGRGFSIPFIGGRGRLGGMGAMGAFMAGELLVAGGGVLADYLTPEGLSEEEARATLGGSGSDASVADLIRASQQPGTGARAVEGLTTIGKYALRGAEMGYIGGPALTAGAAITGAALGTAEVAWQSAMREAMANADMSNLSQDIAAANTLYAKRENQQIAQMNQMLDRQLRTSIGTQGMAGAESPLSSRARSQASQINRAISRLSSTVISAGRIRGIAAGTGDTAQVKSAAAMVDAISTIAPQLTKYGNLIDFVSGQGFAQLSPSQLRNLRSELSKAGARLGSSWNALRERAGDQGADWVSSGLSNQIGSQVTGTIEALAAVSNAVGTELRRRGVGTGQADELRAIEDETVANIAQAATVRAGMHSVDLFGKGGTWITTAALQEKASRLGSGPEARAAFQRFKTEYASQRSQLAQVLQTAGGYDSAQALKLAEEIQSSGDVQSALASKLSQGRAGLGLGADRSVLGSYGDIISTAAQEEMQRKQAEKDERALMHGDGETPVQVNLNVDGEKFASLILPTAVRKGIISAGPHYVQTGDYA